MSSPASHEIELSTLCLLEFTASVMKSPVCACIGGAALVISNDCVRWSTNQCLHIRPLNRTLRPNPFWHDVLLISSFGTICILLRLCRAELRRARDHLRAGL